MVLVGRYSRPSSSSALIIDHTVTLPAYDQESSSHVSLPNSPGVGTVLKVQRTLPVRASKARIQPGICSFLMTSDEIDAGVMIMSRTTNGGDCDE